MFYSFTFNLLEIEHYDLLQIIFYVVISIL
jgi:hypothetical protein